MSDDLLGKLGTLINTRPWYRLPRLLAMGRLLEIRNELRMKNLHDTEEPALVSREIPATLDPALREGRTLDGTSNDLRVPTMGAVGRRFGRNVPLANVVPDTPNLLMPNPRVVSRTLMTREQFQPATILNLIAASWIQFMVHDWFVHKRSRTPTSSRSRRHQATTGATPTIHVPRTLPTPRRPVRHGRPAYANLNSHWWDASQIYGSDADTAAKLRTEDRRQAEASTPTGLLPVDPADRHPVHRLHRQLVDRSRDAAHAVHARAQRHLRYARASTPELERRPAVRQGAADQLGAPRENPHGRVDAGDPAASRSSSRRCTRTGTVSPAKNSRTSFEFLNDDELLGGIVGSNTDHHTAPYSLTEEFVAVYRMHPLIPDELTFRSAGDRRACSRRCDLPEIVGPRDARRSRERITIADLFYSFGISHPGAVTLHNYPTPSAEPDSETTASISISPRSTSCATASAACRATTSSAGCCTRSRCKSFDELTEDPPWREQIARSTTTISKRST